MHATFSCHFRIAHNVKFQYWEKKQKKSNHKLQNSKSYNVYVDCQGEPL